MEFEVLIQPINFLFAGYTVAATENEMVRVTSIETTRTKKFSAELGLTFSGLGGPKASLGPSDERTLKSAEDINAQFEKLGIDIMPNFLRVIRESETGGDVRGNTLVSLSVVTDPSTILNQVPEVAKEDRKKPLGADVVLLVVDTNLDDGPSRTNNEPESISVLPQVPLPHCPLLARVWMFYQKREIARGRESYVEGLQDVRLIEDVYPPKDVEIVSADDVAPAAWSIKILPRGQVEHGGVDDGPFVEAGVGDGPWRSLVFTDYTKASKLAHWLRLNSEDMVTKEGTKAKLGELNFKYPPRASFVPFKTTRTDVCQPNADQKNRGSYQQGG